MYVKVLRICGVRVDGMLSSHEDFSLILRHLLYKLHSWQSAVLQQFSTVLDVLDWSPFICIRSDVLIFWHGFGKLSCESCVSSSQICSIIFYCTRSRTQSCNSRYFQFWAIYPSRGSKLRMLFFTEFTYVIYSNNQSTFTDVIDFIVLNKTTCLLFYPCDCAITHQQASTHTESDIGIWLLFDTILIGYFTCQY